MKIDWRDVMSGILDAANLINSRGFKYINVSAVLMFHRWHSSTQAGEAALRSGAAKCLAMEQ